MTIQTNFASSAALIGDPVRALILNALLDGRALPAGELAFAAGVTPQTASSHLNKLVSGGLFAVQTEGRHRYFRLAGPHVAEALERLAAIRPDEPVRRLAPNREAEAVRHARRCYNHLAGKLGVEVTRRLRASALIMPAADKRFAVTDAGSDWFGSLGIDFRNLKPGARGIARACLDWTEREHHLAGPLGVALLSAFFERNWLRRSRDSRALQITPAGQRGFKDLLNLDLAA